jgi:hypothetical protein
MTRRRPEGELLFEAYVAEHDYPAPKYEPDLGVRTRPDYVVVRGGAEAVCEVEEFDPDSGWSPGNAGPSGRRSMEDVLRPVRYKIRAAARQLKPLAGSGRPLVIVLANPGGGWVGLSPQEIVWAMYGDPAFVVSVDARTGEAVDEGGFITTANGRAIDFYDELAAGMDEASADESWRAIDAAKDRGEVPEGHYHRLDVYRTMSADSAPLPGELFNGPKDRLFEYDEEAGGYVWTGGPSPAR